MKSHDSSSRRKRVICGIALASLAGLAAGADPRAGAAAQEPRFEVVSIKRNTSGGAGSMIIQPGGRLSVRNLSVKQVTVSAFGILSFQLAGGPDWLQNDRFDIQAKAPDGASVTNEAMNAMLRAMLADRLQLKVRRETRESPVYELVFARSDRRLGERLHQTSADCVASLARGARYEGPLIGPDVPVPCGMIMSGGNRVGAGGQTMAQLATLLAPRVQRIVLDKTGLAGLHDFDLQFQPDSYVGGDGPIRMYAISKDVPPLTTAIQEQLGLRLQPARGAVDYVVIESIQPPSED